MAGRGRGMAGWIIGMKRCFKTSLVFASRSGVFPGENFVFLDDPVVELSFQPPEFDPPPVGRTGNNRRHTVPPKPSR